jgi:nodulation protein A
MPDRDVADLHWSLTWEDDVSDDEHAALAGLLRRCFPHSRAGFVGSCSWSNARPELRLVGHDGRRPVAHLGVLRRFVRVGSASLLVGDVGLVAVDPDMRRRRVGAALLGQAADTLHRLELPFGFLSCGEHVAPFYAASGWQRIGNPVRMIRADARVQVYGGVSMALPVRASMEEWPVGGMVDRNGPEV